MADTWGIVKNLWDTFDNNPANQRTVDAIKGMFGLLPAGAGDVASGLLAADDVRRGDYTSAALNGVGVLPFIPSMAGMIKGKGDDIAKAIRQPTKYEQAHEVARQNAVKMLGLPENNTAMDRAKALGFDTDLYHGRYKDYDQIKQGKTLYATPDPEYASLYTNPSASSMGGKTVEDFQNLQPNVMPVMVRSSDMLDTTTKEGRKVFDNDFYMQYGNGTTLSDKGYPDWVDAEDFRDMFSDKGMRFKGVFADEGAVPLPDGGIKSRGVSTAVFDPSAVRSRFAAFDPARINEPDLLGRVNPELLPWLSLGGLLGAGGMYYSGE